MNSIPQKTSSFLLLMLATLVVFAGCNPKTSTSPATQEADNAPQGDDQAAISAVEGLGGKVKLNGNGQVVEVDFTKASISDDAIASLTGFKNLRSLKLAETAIGDSAMPTIAQMTSLTNLDLRGCPLTNDGLAQVETLSNLKALRLSGKSGKTDISDTVFANFGKLKNLKVLAVDFLFAGGVEGITALKGLPLVEFYASHSLVDDEVLKMLADDFPSLKKLRVSGCTVSGQGLQEISRMAQLEELDLSEISLILDDDLSHLKDMNQLRKLNLWRVQVTDEGIKFLAGLTNLKWLNLDNVAYLSDDGLKHLQGMTQLEFLHVGSTSIGDAGLDHLTGLKSLADLKVTRTAVTQQGVQKLNASLPNTAIQLEYEGTP